jgi:hypothetical protein
MYSRIFHVRKLRQCRGNRYSGVADIRLSSHLVFVSERETHRIGLLGRRYKGVVQEVFEILGM